VEDLALIPGYWQGRRVFLTGHTGFKGGWLALWLKRLGANVYGYALAPPTEPNFFTVAQVAGDLAGESRADVRDELALRAALAAAEPEIVLHLAAQPLVRYSYAQPVETYAVNVLGTVHLLEAARRCRSVRAIVNVTTDKCYENHEWVWGYRESEPLGGTDPYSSSKACAELVCAAYRESFLKQNAIALATARAGNVIGGGDWSADRLLPDFLRAADSGAVLSVRHPDATRPWQHVLDPLRGYLALAERLHQQGQRFAGAWNFGPHLDDSLPVRQLLDAAAALLPGTAWQCADGTFPREAHTLKLDSSKARAELGWAPRWRLRSALEQTVRWHQSWRSGQDMHAFSLAQIDLHDSAATEAE
jgi:CDP-glucose 4,6-dehydratase